MSVATKLSKDHILTAAVPLDASSEMSRFPVYGVASVKDQDSVSSFSRVATTLLDGPSLSDFKERLQEFKSLEAGWYDGIEGCPLSAEGIDWLTETWFRFYPYLNSVVVPYLFPTVDGHVQAEWTFGYREVILTIDINNHRGSWHYMDMQTMSDEADEEREIDLEQPEEWSWIFQKISNFQEG